MQLLQLWEKNGYFDESIIQQLQSPALGLGQYQVSRDSNAFLIKYFQNKYRKCFLFFGKANIKSCP